MSTPHSEEGGHLPPPPPPQQQLAESGESGSEAAVREAERWIEAVTGRSFVDKDFRGSLDNGILLCELLNSIKPGLVKKINRLLTPVAGLDNLALFLRGCEELGLKGSQLFDTGDLQDTRNNKGSDSSRKLKNVLITIYWLGRAANSSATYNGPTLDLREFEGLLLQMRKEAEDWDSPKHSIRDSGYIDCWESERSESLSPPRHARDDSFDSLDSIGSRSRHTPSPDGLLARASSDGRGSDSECDFPHRKLPDMRRDDMLARRTSCSEPRTAVPFNQYLPNKSNQTCYVPPQLRRQRTERDENRRSCSNATSPVGGERPFSESLCLALELFPAITSIEPQCIDSASKDSHSENHHSFSHSETDSPIDDTTDPFPITLQDRDPHPQEHLSPPCPETQHQVYTGMEDESKEEEGWRCMASYTPNQNLNTVTTSLCESPRSMEFEEEILKCSTAPKSTSPTPLTDAKKPHPETTISDRSSSPAHSFSGELHRMSLTTSIIVTSPLSPSPHGSPGIGRKFPSPATDKVGGASHTADEAQGSIRMQHSRTSIKPGSPSPTHFLPLPLSANQTGRAEKVGSEPKEFQRQPSWLDDDLSPTFSHRASVSESMSMIDMRSEEESLLSPHSQVRHELMHGQYNRMKEDESHWQDDLARWKSRRRSVSQDLIKKEEERKMMERLLNKEEGTQRRKSIKTYREIVEDKERRERELHEAYLKAKTPEEAAAVLDRYAQRFTISEAVLERLKLPKLLERSVSADPTGLSTSPTTPDPFTSSSSPFQYLRQQSLPAPKFTSTIEARVTGYRADLEDRSGGSRASRLERSAPLLAPKPFRHSRASSAEARSAKWDETERVNGELNNHRDIKREESSPLRFYPSPSLDADSDITDSSVSESQPADRYTTSHTPTHTPEPGREDSECVEKADSQCGGRSNMACVERASDSLVSADSDGVDRPQSECREREVSECVQRTDSESVEGAQSECLQRVDSECVERSYAECVVGSVCEAAGHGGLLPETQSQEEEETQEDQPPSRPTSLPMLPAEEEEVLQAKEEEPTTEPLPESEQSPEKKIKGSSDSTNSQNSTVKTGGQEAQAPSQSDTAAKEVSKPLQESPQRTAYPPEPAIKDKSKPSPVCGSSAIELDNSAQLTPLSSNPKLRWDFFTSSEPAEKQHSNVLNLVRRGEQFSWDPEEERKRQERWQQDQERMLQEKYSREQEKLKQEWERAQKEVEEEERRYHEEERKILEETVAPLTPRSPMPYSSSPCWQEPAALVHSSSTQHSIVHSLADWEGKQDELDKQKWTLDNKRQRENGRSESTGIKEELSHMAGSPLRTSSDQLVGQSNGQREGTEEQNSWGSNTQQKQHSSESWKKSAPVDRSRNTQPGERRRSDSIENPSSHTDTQPPPSPNRSVSGKKLCSSCGLPLGKGAAMIIETLSLYFHIQCFKCGICKGQLGDTSTGTDVRIRNGLLNCHQCYLRSRSAGQPTTL